MAMRDMTTSSLTEPMHLALPSFLMNTLHHDCIDEMGIQAASPGLRDQPLRPCFVPLVPCNPVSQRQAGLAGSPPPSVILRFGLSESPITNPTFVMLTVAIKLLSYPNNPILVCFEARIDA